MLTALRQTGEAKREIDSQWTSKRLGREGWEVHGHAKVWIKRMLWGQKRGKQYWKKKEDTVGQVHRLRDEQS